MDEVAIREWGMPGLVLMENAGRGVADVMCNIGIEGKVVIACAKGNNGGDGFVLARHLNLRGFEAEVLLCCDESELIGDAKMTFSWLQRCEVAIHASNASSDTKLLHSADWVVDGLLGTGAMGPPRAPLDTLIRLMNTVDTRRLALDVPSGLDCDTGEASDPTFVAEHTCTFVAPKSGLVLPAAKPFVGEIHCLDIGVPWSLIDQIIAV